MVRIGKLAGCDYLSDMLARAFLGLRKTMRLFIDDAEIAYESRIRRSFLFLAFHSAKRKTSPAEFRSLIRQKRQKFLR